MRDVGRGQIAGVSKFHIKKFGFHPMSTGKEPQYALGKGM